MQNETLRKWSRFNFYFAAIYLIADLIFIFSPWHKAAGSITVWLSFIYFLYLLLSSAYIIHQTKKNFRDKDDQFDIRSIKDLAEGNHLATDAEPITPCDERKD